MYELQIHAAIHSVRDAAEAAALTVAARSPDRPRQPRLRRLRNPRQDRAADSVADRASCRRDARDRCLMTKCLICDHAIEPFISFGRMPIANGFLTPDQFADESFFELATGFCDRCKMVQLTELVDPDKMFHENYAFFSSTSSRMAAHFQALAEHIKARHLGRRSVRRRDRQQRRHHAPALRDGRHPPPRHRAVRQRRARWRAPTASTRSASSSRAGRQRRSSPSTVRPTRSSAPT